MTSTANVSSRSQECVLHGVHVPDPYRWLENRSLPATDQWIRDQNRRCNGYFEQCEFLPSIRSRVKALLDFATVDQPVRVGKRSFYRRRDPGVEQASIYSRDLETDCEDLLVPAPDDPFASVRIHRVSPTGKFLAYELRRGGTDRRTIHALDVETSLGLDTDVSADWFRGLVFNETRRGFFYCLDTTCDPKEHTIHWRPFESHTNDCLCFRAPLAPFSRLLLTSDETHIGAMYIRRDGADDLLDFWIAKLSDTPPVSWHRVFRKQRLPFCPILIAGRIFAKTNNDQFENRYVEFDRDGRELNVAIPAMPGQILQVMGMRRSLLIHRFHDRKGEIQRWSLDGEKLGYLDVQEGSTVSLLPQLAGAQESIFLSCESFTAAPTIYEFDGNSCEARLWHLPCIPRPQAISVANDASYVSADGTTIPITMVSLAASEPSQSSPCIMTAYGGFGVPGTPQYSVLITILLELGVTFALPHIRGGGDFGQDWHDAGRGRYRQRSIEDFLAAAEWLLTNRLVKNSGLAIFGGSNSGLLVGAALTQRPDLFRACLCIAPLLDMVRYERFDRAARWRSEYGTVDDQQDFNALYGYSPYHKVKDHTDYPATLFVTGDCDDRCDPAHVRKMAAALQNRNAQLRPIVVDYSEMRGHTPVLPLSVRVDALTRRIAFLCRELGLELPPSGVV